MTKKPARGPVVRTSRTKAAKPAEVQLQPSPGHKVLITDVALRDGHQSLLATSRHIDMLDEWGGKPLQGLRGEVGQTYQRAKTDEV